MSYFFRVPSFTDHLAYEPTGTKRNGLPEYRLTQPFSFEIGGFGSNTFITVPVGFITDLASIPWGFRWMLLADGPYVKAAVVHDFMYEYADHFGWHRPYCDMVFMTGMRVLRVSLPVRLAVYYAVRFFGGSSFKRYSRLPPGTKIIQSSSPTKGIQN